MRDDTSMVLANRVKEVTTQFADILSENLSTVRNAVEQSMTKQASGSDYGLRLQELNSSRVTPGA